MHAILAIATKDLRLLLRDKTAFFFVFIFPLIIGILFGYIFSGGGGGGGPSGVKVLLVDADGTDASRAFADALAAEGTLAITPATDAAAAEDQVRTGAVAAVITVPSGFQESMRGVFTGAGAPIDVAIDPARQFERGIIEGLVTAAGFRTLADSFTDPSQSLAILERSRVALRDAEGVPALQRTLLDTLLTAGESLVRDRAATASQAGGDGAGGGVAGGFTPIRVAMRSVARDATRDRSAFEITFPQASAWGIMGVVMGFGISIVTERSSGTLTRLLMAPITKWHVIAGKAVGCFVGSLMVQVVLFAVGVTMFGIRPGSWPMLGLAVVSGCVGFVGVMMLLAVVGRTAAASEGISRATLIVLALVGGAGIPLMVMPPFMRTIASVSPFKWLILALEGALWRDFSVREMALPCGVLVGVGVVGFVLGAMMFRDEE